MRVPPVLQVISNKNSSGFTLIEVMMAILILMVGMLGLLQAINLTLEVNLRNQLREEAVNVGQRVMSELRNNTFDNLSTNYALYKVPSNIRGTARTYDVTRTSTVISTQNSLPVTKQLMVLVQWTYKGVTYENRVITPVSIIR